MALYAVGPITAKNLISSADVDQYFNLLTGVTTNTPVTIGNSIGTTGITGALNATRYVGATVSGAPTTGTFAIGDMVIDRTFGRLFICVTAGTPGTWNLAGNGPSVRATNSAAQTIGTGTWAAMTYNTNTWDTDSYHSTVTNTSRFTVTIPGKYLVTARVAWFGRITGQRGIGLRKNGVGTIPDEGASILPNVGGADGNNVIATALYNLVATDYVEVLVFQSSGVNNDVTTANSSPEAAMTWVGN